MMISGTTNLLTRTRVILRAGEAAKAADARVDSEQVNQAVVAGQQRVETQQSAEAANVAAECEAVDGVEADAQSKTS
ncbi:MAG: hypothetical protein ACRERX_14375 [Pseudomonas sp.]